MDRSVHLFLLNALAVAGLTCATAAFAESADGVGVSADNPQVVDPRVERRDINVAGIDTENFEAGAYIGTISIEDFGSDVVFGARLAYHFTEDLFAEVNIATAEAGKTSYEDLSGSAQLLTDSERKFTSYDLSLGWNILPGEVFFGGQRAMPSSFYLTAGAGSTRFGGDDNFTVALGAGMRLLVTDWLAGHLTVRDLAFDSDLLGKSKQTHNLQVNLGVTAFF
jgi:outer membrane beta-barrel protein